MYHKILVVIILFGASARSLAQEYRVITTVESFGSGQSSMIDHQVWSDYKPLTTERIAGKKREKPDRKKNEPKIEKFSETKLQNLYSGATIDLQHVATNDAVVSSKLTDMAKGGWQLLFVTSGVESDCGDKDHGVFITRYVFKK